MFPSNPLFLHCWFAQRDTIQSIKTLVIYGQLQFECRHMPPIRCWKRVIRRRWWFSAGTVLITEINWFVNNFAQCVFKSRYFENTVLAHTTSKELPTGLQLIIITIIHSQILPHMWYMNVTWTARSLALSKYLVKSSKFTIRFEIIGEGVRNYILKLSQESQESF